MPEPNTGCWLWMGGDAGDGYGVFQMGTNRAIRAHRAAYQIYKGSIPEGLTLDHLCRVRCCVNPDHLEPVPHIENVRRGNYRKGLALGGIANGERQKAKTHCPQGHPYSGSNLIIEARNNGRSGRVCRTCRNARARAGRRA